MKHISARDFQLNAAKYLKELPIILTHHNIPIATVIPYANVTTSAPARPIHATTVTKGEPLEFVSATVQFRCEAPNTVCRNAGEKYMVEYVADEGMERKAVSLCEYHASIARKTTKLMPL
jgi:hypothetical protein